MADPLMLATLIELGFDRSKSEKALINVNNRGIEGAIDWIMAHTDSNDQSTDPTASANMQSQEGQPSSETTAETNRPLTEEEKKEKLEKLESKIKERRRLREAEERKLEKDQEISRRESGKMITDVKRKVEIKEMQKLAEQRKREKMEDRLAREKVKAMIAEDRARAKGKPDTTNSVTSQQTSTKVESSTESTVKKEYTNCRIQVRLSNGSNISATFDVNDTIATVMDFVRKNRTDGDCPFNLMTTFPRKVYSENDMDMTVKDAGFVPSISLVLRNM
ncbi:UBX domain-containing protein 1 [Trichoplax sp. H2]|uniref:UBX domain-containing protein n=1 Tax=Trichoplax adhaerens TaxID=10228 RepID=B3RYW5_TRIAD|nr:hypothetical protein TRIADDRAFT_57239 [Trichoplax adhaerens]EDV23741.1 hypothetical protein TRIADDRAFT_57239 [Trichoplax adhaerens]RDD44316.1 UBX domain-containing protein 1 [Trichoplax sp. H2]|eukprot:XP_002113267.1 hypothetical protein TRIADDRAFT_57239 [Trichoplax adhaerens]